MPTPAHICRPKVLCFACLSTAADRPNAREGGEVADEVAAEVERIRPLRSPFGAPTPTMTLRQAAHRRAMLTHLRRAR